MLSWESSPSSWLQSTVHHIQLVLADRDSCHSGAAAESSTFRAIWNQTGILVPACQAAKEDSSTQAYPWALRMGLAPWRHLRKISTPSFPDYLSFRVEFSCLFFQEALPDLPGWNEYIPYVFSITPLTTLPPPLKSCLFWSHCVGTGSSTSLNSEPCESRAQPP